MSGALRIAVVLLVAAAATIVANVVLLGVASGRHDPVGQLSPLTFHPQPPRPRPAPTAATPGRTVHEADGRADD